MDHPGYYVGQRVIVCINDGLLRVWDEGNVIRMAEESPFVVVVQIEGKGIFQFRDRDVIDADWLHQAFLAQEDRGFVERYTRPDGTLGWVLTDLGRRMKSGVLDRLS